MIDTSKLNITKLTTATSDSTVSHPPPAAGQIWVANTGYRRNMRRRLAQVTKIDKNYVYTLSWWEEHTPHTHRDSETPLTECIKACAWLRVGSTPRVSRVQKLSFTTRKSNGFTLLTGASALTDTAPRAKTKRVRVRQAQVNDTSGAILGIMDKTKIALTGHDIMLIFNNTLGDYWTMTRSQVYRELVVLAENGYVMPMSQGERRKQPYRLTTLGRRAAREWLLSPSELDTPRSVFALQLTLINTPRDATVLHHIRESLIRAHQAKLTLLYEKLADVRRRTTRVGVDSPHPDSIQFAIYYHEMVVRWASGIQLGDTTSEVNLADVVFDDDTSRTDDSGDTSNTSNADDTREMVTYIASDASAELTNLRDHVTRCVCSTPSIPKITSPAELDVPPSLLDVAVRGAAELDPHAYSLNGRNFLAHALKKLLSEDWINPAQLTSLDDHSFGCDK